MICWAIWKQRNEQLWQDKSSPAGSVVIIAKNYLLSWQRANMMRDRRLVVLGNDVPVIWSPLSPGWLMMNTNALVNISRNRRDLALIMRSLNDSFVATSGVPIHALMDVRLAEGMAFKEALLRLKNSHQNNVMIESDERKWFRQLIRVNSLIQHLDLLSLIVIFFWFFSQMSKFVVFEAQRMML